MSVDRQAAKRIEGIRRDHLERYRYAMSLAEGPVLDAACGVGYGAYLLASDGHGVKQKTASVPSVAAPQRQARHLAA